MGSQSRPGHVARTGKIQSISSYSKRWKSHISDESDSVFGGAKNMLRKASRQINAVFISNKAVSEF